MGHSSHCAVMHVICLFALSAVQFCCSCLWLDDVVKEDESLQSLLYKLTS